MTTGSWGTTEYELNPRLGAIVRAAYVANLVWDSQFSVDETHQPERADHEELHVLEERRALAFVMMTDELADPRDDEQHDAHDPQRPRQLLQPEDRRRHTGYEQHHAHAERPRHREVI